MPEFKQDLHVSGSGFEVFRLMLEYGCDLPGLDFGIPFQEFFDSDATLQVFKGVQTGTLVPVKVQAPLDLRGFLSTALHSVQLVMVLPPDHCRAGNSVNAVLTELNVLHLGMSLDPFTEVPPPLRGRQP